MERREFIRLAPAIAAEALTKARAEQSKVESLKYRIAFGLWINDMRNEVAPLENWPYGALDDETVDSIRRALDAQSAAGYTAIDLAGLLSIYAWPVDIVSIADKDRRRRVNQIIKAAHEQKMKVICFPSGVLSWGFDEIIKHDPAVQTDNRHVMNPLREESWQWQRKVLDYMIDTYDIDGVHLESADQGRCKTKECLEKWPNDVAYHSYVTARTAQYLRGKKPSLTLLATVQGFSTWGRDFMDEEKNLLVDLSHHVDCLFDQGHAQTYIPQSRRRELIGKLHCGYGTSGGLWIYPPQRWDRTRWFLPYTMRTGTHIRQLYEDGGQGVMFYQGPVRNPSTEVNIAFGGRIMTNPRADLQGVLQDTLEKLYKPKNRAALGRLTAIYRRAEDGYFENWNSERIAATRKRPQPGELHLASLFGASPNAADYLFEPYLDTEGRYAYKQTVVGLLKELTGVSDQFADDGRILRIKYGLEAVLADINNIALAKGENKVWDDRNVNRLF